MLIEHVLLDLLLNIGGRVLRLAAIHDKPDCLFWEGYLFPCFSTVLPATTEMRLVYHLHFFRLNDGASHLAVPAVLVGVFAILMGHGHNLAILAQSDFAASILAVGTIILE